MRRILSVFILACTLLMWPSIIFAAEPKVITAQDLFKAVTNDLEAARSLYLYETIHVSGIVVSKGISRYLTPNVVLSDRAGGSEMIICVLPRLDAAKLSDFQPGQSVTFTGRVQAMSQRVVMKECKVYTP